MNSVIDDQHGMLNESQAASVFQTKVFIIIYMYRE